MSSKKNDLKSDSKDFIEVYKAKVMNGKHPQKTWKDPETKKTSYVVKDKYGGESCIFPNKSCASSFVTSNVDKYGELTTSRRIIGSKDGKEVPKVGLKKKTPPETVSHYQQFVKDKWSDPSFKSSHLDLKGKIDMKSAMSDISKEWKKMTIK